MVHHSNDADIQFQGCVLLGQLDFQDWIAEANGIEIIMQAMRRHEQNADVQRWGCYALGQLAFGHPKNQSKIGSTNGIDLILRAMRQHEHHAKMQECGCDVMNKLAFQNPENQRRVAEANGVDVIVQAMRRHEAHDKVQRSGCDALDELAFRNPENQLQQVEDAYEIDNWLLRIPRTNVRLDPHVLEDAHSYDFSRIALRVCSAVTTVDIDMVANGPAGVDCTKQYGSSPEHRGTWSTEELCKI